MKGSKLAGQSLYINPRWNIIPQMELCQFYPSGNQGWRDDSLIMTHDKTNHFKLNMNN